MPARRSTKRQPHPAQKKLHFGKPKTVAGWLWRILIAVITLVGGWALVRPVVHIDPFIQLDPSSPFSERFKVANDGLFAIYDVYFSCHITKAMLYPAGHVTDIGIIGPNKYRKVIEAADSTTIDCPLSQAVAFPGRKYISAEIELKATFRPSWYPWHKEKTSKFSGQLDSQGNVQWLH